MVTQINTNNSQFNSFPADSLVGQRHLNKEQLMNYPGW
jgi:hypothetical protein